MKEKTTRSVFQPRYLLLGLLGIVLLAGAVTAYRVGQSEEMRARTLLLERAATAAAAVNPRQVAGLAGTEADLVNPDYLRLKEQLGGMRLATGQIRFYYLVRREGEKLILLCDSESPSSEDYSPPGQVYEEAAPEFSLSLMSGTRLVFGPVKDRWGAWMTGVVPVLDADGKVIAALGADIAARHWTTSIAHKQREPIIVTLLLAALTILLYAMLSRDRKAREVLHNSETKFRMLYELTSDAVMLLDKKGFFDCNNATLRIFGCPSREEFCSKHPADLSPPVQPCGTDSMALASQQIATALEEGSCRFEWVHRRADGADFPAEVLLNALEIEGRKVLQAVVRDITERKRNEKVLANQRTELQTILDASPSLIFYKDKENRYVRVNRAFADLIGLPKEQIEGRSAFEIFPDLAEAHGRDELQVVDSAEPKLGVAELLQTPTGIRWLRTDKIPHRNEHGDVVGIIGFSEDITERRLIEETLRENEEKLTIITDSAQDAIIMMDPDGNISFWNRAAVRTFGLSQEEALGRNLHELLAPPTYHAAHHEAFAAFRRTGQGNAVGKTLELSALRKDGSEFPVEISLSSVQLLGRWHGVGIVRDITDRKRMERELRESEERVRTILELIHTGIAIVDARTHEIVEVNPAAVALIGAPKEQIVGRVCHKFICPAEVGQCPITDLGKTINNAERILRKADGTEIAILKTATRVTLAEGTAFSTAS